MMKKKNPNQPFHVPPVIPCVRGTSKFKYEVVVTGEWDWNGAVAGDEWDSILPIQGRIGPFSDSMRRALSTLIFDASIGAKEVRLTNVELTPEMSAAWNRYIQNLQGSQRRELEAELEALEARRLQIEKVLGTVTNENHVSESSGGEVVD